MFYNSFLKKYQLPMLHTAAKKKAPRPPVGTPLFSLRLSVYQSPLKKASKIFTDYAFPTDPNNSIFSFTFAMIAS